MNEDELFKRKILDTANRAYKQNIYTYTGFLSMSELSCFHKLSKEIDFVAYELFGGSPTCERQMIQFGSEQELGYAGTYPIAIVKVSPLTPKFAETNSHRDYLGALMNLGIERSLVGDIKIDGIYAYIFVVEHIASFIVDNLTTVRHTHVQCSITTEFKDTESKFEDIEVISASSRVDAVVASISRLSRSKAVELFRTSKVYVNGICCENNSYQLKPDDILVIRGIGKFIFVSAGSKTRKERVYVTLKKYL